MIRRRSAAVVLGATALTLGFLAQSGPAVGALTPPVRAAAYINPDIGLGTSNPDVNRDSDCARPDSSDIQALSAPGTASNNVHVDACLFSSTAAPGADESDVDTTATFEIFGVGTFSGCPDPDGPNGPKTSVRHDHDSNGTLEHCHVSGYQTAGMGANEYHARVNNTTSPGQTRVLFCYDPDQDGCLDESVVSQVAIGWTPRAS